MARIPGNRYSAPVRRRPMETPQPLDPEKRRKQKADVRIPKREYLDRMTKEEQKQPGKRRYVQD